MMNPRSPLFLREFAKAKDVRIVELTGNESSLPGKDGHVRIDVSCPWCDAVCWLHFGLDGSGRFLCKPCGAIGVAEHGEYDGRRQVELTLEGQVDDSETQDS